MKFKLSIANVVKRHILTKPKKYKLINPEILNIITNSRFYNSSFDDPLQGGLTLDDLCYRLTQDQKEQWVEGIVNDDPRIFRIRQRKNFVILVCKNETNGGKSNNIYRYITFVDERKGENDGIEEEGNAQTEKKKNRLHYVPNKPRLKKRSGKKSRRK